LPGRNDFHHICGHPYSWAEHRTHAGMPAAVERRVLVKELAILAERLAVIAAELQAFGEK